MQDSEATRFVGERTCQGVQRIMEGAKTKVSRKHLCQRETFEEYEICSGMGSPFTPHPKSVLGADPFRCLSFAEETVVSLNSEERWEIFAQGTSLEDFASIVKTIALEA